MMFLVPFNLVLLLAAVPCIWAQSATSSASSTALLATLPDCALSCLLSGIEASPCSLSNTTCVCANSALQTSVTLCVSQNCTTPQALFTKNVTETVCQVPVRDDQQLPYLLTVIFGVISATMVLIRLSFKMFVVGVQPGLDDWFIVITFVSGIPSTVIECQAIIPNGLGKDIWTLTSTQITNFGMFFYVMAVLYFLQVTLLKMSLLFFYLKIFPGKTVKRFLWGTVIFNVIFGLFFVLITIFQCQPISYYWTKWDGEHSGKCLGIDAIAWSNAAVSIALDIWMLAIPLSQLRQLHMHWKKKIGVAMMFIVGAFVTVVSILRLQSLVQFGGTQNPSWDYLGVSIWSVVEINVGIICTCMPSLRLILVRIFPALGGTTHARNKYYQSGSFGNIRSQGRSRAGTGGQMPSIVHYPEPTKKSAIYQQKTYTVQYGDDDEESLFQMQNLGSKSSKPSTKSQGSI